jgi:hypothetical protein
MAMYVAVAAAKNPYLPPSKLLAIDVVKLDDVFLADCYNRVVAKYNKVVDKYAQPGGGYDFDQMAKGPDLLKALTAELKRRFTPKSKKAKKGNTRFS